MPKHAPVTDAVSTAAYLNSLPLSLHAVADCSLVCVCVCVVQLSPALLSVSHTEEERNTQRSLALRLQIDAAIMHTVKLLIITSLIIFFAR